MKNLIIVILSIALVLSVLYGVVQNTEARKLKSEAMLLQVELKKMKTAAKESLKRSELMAEMARQNAENARLEAEKKGMK